MCYIDKVVWKWSIAELAMVVTAAAMKITRDGKYTQVTVKINEDIPESQCAKLLANLKVGWTYIYFSAFD